MARALRIEFRGAYYHITTRGNERKNIFKTDKDREQFLSYLKSATERYGAVISVYCLMSSHYHLLLQTPMGNLSEIMRHINGAYTTYFNVKRQRSGHLFQGRYKAILIDMDEYAQELSRYIHLNPVRAGIVDRPEGYQWSSYLSYIRHKKQHEWLERDFILRLFGKGQSQSQRGYKKFVKDMIEKQYESPLQQVFASTILGSSGFIRKVQNKYLKGREPDKNLPALKQITRKPTIEKISREVAAVFKDDALVSRTVKLYLCQRYTGLQLRVIGEYFGIGESGVCQASRRLDLKMKGDSGLQKKVDKIKGKLWLSRMKT